MTTTISPDQMHTTHVKDLAAQFINPATDAPYTTRGVLKWGETHLGITPVDNRFTDRQVKILQAWYQDIVLGKGSKEAFLQQYSDDLNVIWQHQGQETEVAPEPERSADHHDYGGAATEDGLFGALVPVMDSLNADLRYVGDVCDQAENYVVEETLNRIEAMPQRIAAKLTQRAHQRFGTQKNVRQVPTMGAISEAFRFPQSQPQPAMRASY